MELTENELDALAEIINIGSGRAAYSLSELTDSRIELSVPHLYCYDKSNFSEMATKFNLEFGTTVQQGFEGKMLGHALLAFPKANAFELARIVGGIPVGDAEMDQELYGVLEEIGNIVLNAILGSLANLVDCSLTYSLPALCENDAILKTIFSKMTQSGESANVVLVADTSLIVASHDISGSLILLFETGDIEIILAALAVNQAC